MTFVDKARLSVLWFIAIMFVVYQLAVLYFNVMPSTHWIKYYSVSPKKENIKVGDTLRFVSHLDIYKSVGLSFNDILFRVEDGEFIRYCSQNTKRSFVKSSLDKYTTWPFTNSPSHPGTYCLESNIQIHLPLHTDRTQQFDGCEAGLYFEVVE